MGSIHDAAKAALPAGPSSNPTEINKSDLAAVFALVEAAISQMSTANVRWLTSVRVATTANGAISTAFENGDTVDGVTLATNDRILIKNQLAPSANGIYVVQATGSPVRATDADSVAELIGAAVYVTAGTANSGTAWTCSNTAANLVTLGTDAVTFAQVPGVTAISLLSTAISDSSSVGRSIVTAANAAAVMSALGMSANGQSLVTAANYAAMKTLLGLDEINTAEVADAAITLAKIQNLSPGYLMGRVAVDAGPPQQVFIGGGLEISGSNVRRAAITGDVDVTAGLNESTIPNDTVTNAKAANMAEGTVKMRRAGAGTGDPTDTTLANLKTDLALVKGDVGLGNVDNTSDANKPISTATQMALDLKATTASVVSEAGTRLAADEALSDAIGALSDAVDVKADDSAVVKLTGAQTVAGVKTFSSAPVVPDAAFSIAKTNSLQSALDDKVDFNGRAQRPGDAPLSYTTVLTAGDPAALAPLLPADTVTDDDGRAVRIVGVGLVAQRNMWAIEDARVYQLRAVVRRRVNTPDPSNDSVRVGIAWYDRDRVRLAGGGASTIVTTINDLTVASGRREVIATVSRGAGLATLTAPAGALYGRIWAQTFGSSSTQTDVEVLGELDTTDLSVFAPDVSAFNSRLVALESLDLGDRVNDLEATVGTPSTKAYVTKGDLAAATVPGTVDTVIVYGNAAPGDDNDGAPLMLFRDAAATVGYLPDAAATKFAVTSRTVKLSKMLWGYDYSDATGVANKNALLAAAGYLKDKGGGGVVIPGDEFYTGNVKFSSFPVDIEIEGKPGNRLILPAGGTGQIFAFYARGVFYQVATPTATGVGDLWNDVAVGSAAIGTWRRWSGSAWDIITIDDVANGILVDATLKTNGIHLDVSGGIDSGGGQYASPFVAAYFKRWEAEDCTLIGSTGFWGTGGGDSGFSPICVGSAYFKNNYVQGMRDVAYYVGGDNKVGPAGDGNQILIEGGLVERCNSIVHNKREGFNTVVRGLQGMENRTGFMTLEVGAGYAGVGRRLDVQGCSLFKTGLEAFRARAGAKVIFQNNLIEDFGYSPDTLVSAGGSAYAMTVSGARNVIAKGNTIRLREWARADHRALSLSNATIDGVDYVQGGHHFSNNTYEGIARIVVESAGGDASHFLWEHYNDISSTKFNSLHAGTLVTYTEYGSAAIKTRYGGNDGALMAPVATVTIADDGVHDFGSIAADIKLVELSTVTATSPVLATTFRARTVGSGVCSIVSGLTTNIAAGTTALTGTTGTDGNINVAATVGHFFVENRTGAPISVRMLVKG